MSEPPPKLQSPALSGRDLTAWPCLIAWLAAVALFLRGEWAASIPDAHPLRDPVRWLLEADIDTLAYLTLLALAPLAWRWRGRPAAERSRAAFSRAGRTVLVALGSGERGSVSRGLALSTLIALASLGASVRVARQFDDLPPAFHDEYSYLFQARTFLAGRVSYPSHALAPLFDQMHVLNGGRFASRYFPGTGAWLAPFVLAGHPAWGHWLAGALCAALMFWCGRELAGEGAGLVAGLLTALSPGMSLFSNLLLAHQPTLVGLSLFLLAWLRSLRQDSLRWAVIGGLGLAFAALCRPMTAAGVALPFGLHLLWRLAGSCRGAQPTDRAARIGLLAAWGAPLLAGAGFLAWFNDNVTGCAWVTPYGLYTQRHTPRHVYGFNNVVRGEQRLGPEVLDHYDRWAENLTLRLAAQNVRDRWSASWRWTVGILPLAMALVFGLSQWRSLSTGTRLTLAAIGTLHAVHVPYWFVGMFDHHYVFEAGPLWALWTGAVTVRALGRWDVMNRPAMTVWWLAVLATGQLLDQRLEPGHLARPPLWSAPLAQACGDVRFAREQHGRFRRLIAELVHPRPALVLVEADPADRHIEHVDNHPALDGEVLIGRYLPERIPLAEVRQAFPDRALFIYHARDERLERVAVP